MLQITWMSVETEMLAAVDDDDNSALGVAFFFARMLCQPCLQTRRKQKEKKMYLDVKISSLILSKGRGEGGGAGA